MEARCLIQECQEMPSAQGAMAARHPMDVIPWMSSHKWLHRGLLVEGITWHYSLNHIASFSAELIRCMPVAALLAALLSLMIIWVNASARPCFRTLLRVMSKEKAVSHDICSLARAHLSCAGLTRRRTRARCGCIG